MKVVKIKFMADSKYSMEDIVSLCKRRGFIFQGSEVYGGLSGTWDYGPLGVMLKRKLMQLWWEKFVEERDDMFGIDAAILMNQRVWIASGHADGFSDPMVRDTVTKEFIRADHLLKDNGIGLESGSIAEVNEKIEKNQVLSPLGNPLSPAVSFNMMLKTIMGPNYVSIDGNGYDYVGGKIDLKDKAGFTTSVNIHEREGDSLLVFDSSSVSYLRPETAQGIFTNYKNVVDTIYPDLPFGLAQQGKAFRNEISPRDFVFRSREFEQMEIEYFVKESDWEEEFEKWAVSIYEWFELIGLPKDMIHEDEVPEEDRAHYSKRTVDFEFDFPHGRDELLGLAYRTNFDLTNIQNAAGRNMEYTVKGTNEKFIPHVIEPSFGVERAIMAVLTSAYHEEEVDGEKRVVLKLKPELAPYRFVVSPLLRNKEELASKAKEVYSSLKKKYGNVLWDDNGNIGKRYRRADEIGVPKCIVIDFQTLEDGTVTVRDRDTMEQARVKIEEL
jgi:glycyl-tRNA synthetase